MIDPGEIAADVSLEHMAHFPGHDMQAQGPQSVMRVAPWTKAETAIEKVRFKHSLQNACNRALQQAVRHSWDTQWPYPALARSFGYLDPPHRWRTIGACFQLLTDFLHPLLYLAGELSGGLPIDPACRMPVHHPPSFLEE